MAARIHGFWVAYIAACTPPREPRPRTRTVPNGQHYRLTRRAAESKAQIAHLDADDVGIEASDELRESGPVALHPKEQAVGVPRHELVRLLAGAPLLPAGAGRGGGIARVGSGCGPLLSRGAVLRHGLEEALHRQRAAAGLAAPLPASPQRD